METVTQALPIVTYFLCVILLIALKVLITLRSIGRVTSLVYEENMKIIENYHLHQGPLKLLLYPGQHKNEWQFFLFAVTSFPTWERYYRNKNNWVEK